MTRDLARAWARFYRSRGINCLPACVNKSRPAMSSYSKERDEGFPLELIDRWWTPCVQVCTGARWGLAVIDLDGPTALAVWHRWTRLAPCPPTWAVSTPRGGLHLWFSVPADVRTVPYAVLWELPHARHECIELLGDHRLAMAPPSIRQFPDGSVGRYRFLPGFSPLALGAPAPLPAWVLGLAGAMDRGQFLGRPHRGPALKRPRIVGAGRYDRRLVLASIPDKPALAASWGLRLASARPNPAGWLSCHAIDREDRRPSASFHHASGTYSEPATRIRHSLFDLGALIGPYQDWLHCLAELGRTYGVPTR